MEDVIPSISIILIFLIILCLQAIELLAAAKHKIRFSEKPIDIEYPGGEETR
jgi:hypothetical protein